MQFNFFFDRVRHDYLLTIQKQPAFYMVGYITAPYLKKNNVYYMYLIFMFFAIWYALLKYFVA